MDVHDDTPMTDQELAEAERGRALVAAAMADPQTFAPASLREAIERERAKASAPRQRRPVGGRLRGWALGGAGALAVAVVALVIVLGGGDGGGSRSGPSVVQIAAIGRLPATSPAPVSTKGTSPSQARLAYAVDGLAFPDWDEAFDWPASGRRSDRVGGRTVATVFYRGRKGAVLGYSIVAGEPLAELPAGRDVMRGGHPYRVIHADGRTTVTWVEAGHTCVIDSPSTVPDDRLVEFASWANA